VIATAWIESHQTLKDNPKTSKLSSLMGWDLDITIGKLHRLWWWCLDYCPDGNVSRLSADMVAIAIGLPPNDGEKLIKSLYNAGFLDKTLKKQFLIHDWLDYAGRYLRDSRYKRNPDKYKEIKDLHETVVSRLSAIDNGKSKVHVSRLSAVPNQPTNQPKNKNKDLLSQIEIEEKKFILSKAAVDSFIAVSASRNKTGILGDPRKLSLLCQLGVVLTETEDEAVFRDALLEMTGKDIANINYLKQVITSKKKGGNSGRPRSRQAPPGETGGDNTESEKYNGLGTVIDLEG